jgi:hypothetical protein
MACLLQNRHSTNPLGAIRATIRPTGPVKKPRRLYHPQLLPRTEAIHAAPMMQTSQVNKKPVITVSGYLGVGCYVNRTQFWNFQ